MASVQGPDGAGPVEAVCYKCGATDHTAKRCRQRGATGFAFATCFVCGETGHLAGQCPKNDHGLYPYGGGCKFCGSVNHYARDCRPTQAEGTAPRGWPTQGGSRS